MVDNGPYSLSQHLRCDVAPTCLKFVVNTGVAQNTFTINVHAQATGLPGIFDNRTASLGAIYQNIANGDLGAVYLEGIENVNDTFVDDGRCALCHICLVPHGGVV